MRKSMVTAAALAALLGLGAPALAAQKKQAHAASPAPMSTKALSEHIRILSSDKFEGREPGSAGEKLTLDYIVAQFKKAGLKPGWNGKWLQEVPLVEIAPTTDPQIAFNGADGQKPLTFRKDFVAVAQKTTDPAVDLKGAPLVFVGYGVNAPEVGWNDYAGVDMHGKIAVILVNDPDFEAAPNAPVMGKFGGKAMTYYGRWTYKFEEAGRQGAAGALIVHETAPAAYGWEVVDSSWTGPQFTTPKAATDPVTPMAGWMQRDVAIDLFKRAGLDYQTLKAAAQTPGFKPVPLSLTADVSIKSAAKVSPSYNVIGVLPGKTAPSETILYGAHWDHLGHCTPRNGDDICNGAVDNASGVSSLIEIARKYHADGAARRSVTFIAFTAEEQGLLGSAYYATHPAFPANKTAGGFNMDSMNVAGRTKDVVVTGFGKSDLEDTLRTAAAAQNRVLVPEDRPEAGHYYRSDHFPLAKVGIPMLDAKSGIDLLNGGKERGESLAEAYVKERYHAPTDQFEANWDLSGMQEDTMLLYRTGRAVADSATWPQWKAGAEFKKARDDSMR